MLGWRPALGWPLRRAGREPLGLRPTVPEGLGANIAEVGLAEEAPR